MDEQTAKTKWCPMSRSGYAESVGEISNRATFNKQFDGTCIASACMIGCDDEGKWLGHCGLRVSKS